VAGAVVAAPEVEVAGAVVVVREAVEEQELEPARDRE